MRVFFLAILFSSSFIGFGQEIKSVYNSEHSIKLLKFPHTYSLEYSDIYSNTKNVFNFQIKETIYNIILEGFKSTSNHSVIIKAGNDIIVNFNFVTINGLKMLRINQNNLLSNTEGTSNYFSKIDIENLFTKP